ncbi:hypothetical protein GW17_00028478 [Ensete ventricosum]|nr:hypothetical protein GW17_00028478 [Ensete ventricosum]
MDEGREVEVGEVGGEAKRKLYHHVIGMIGGGVGEDKVRSGGNDNAQEDIVCLALYWSMHIHLSSKKDMYSAVLRSNPSNATAFLQQGTIFLSFLSFFSTRHGGWDFLSLSGSTLLLPLLEALLIAKELFLQKVEMRDGGKQESEGVKRLQVAMQVKVMRDGEGSE